MKHIHERIVVRKKKPKHDPSRSAFIRELYRQELGRPSPAEIRARKREVAQRYKRGHLKKDAGLRRLRKYHIEIHARYVGAADTEDLDRWLIAYRDHLLKWEDKVQALRDFAGRLGRKISKAHAKRIINSIAPRRWNADSIGKYLGITYAVRQELGLWTIGCKDVDKAGRKKLRKECNRLTQERRRRVAGAQPRAEYEANSDAAKARAEGVSRKTIYRRKRAEQAKNLSHVPCPSAVLFSQCTADTPAPLERPQGNSRGSLAQGHGPNGESTASGERGRLLKRKTA